MLLSRAVEFQSPSNPNIHWSSIYWVFVVAAPGVWDVQKLTIIEQNIMNLRLVNFQLKLLWKININQ